MHRTTLIAVLAMSLSLTFIASSGFAVTYSTLKDCKAKNGNSCSCSETGKNGLCCAWTGVNSPVQGGGTGGGVNQQLPPRDLKPNVSTYDKRGSTGSPPARQAAGAKARH